MFCIRALQRRAVIVASPPMTSGGVLSSLLPPPRWGRVGVGVVAYRSTLWTPPSPPLPRKGEGKSQCMWGTRSHSRGLKPRGMQERERGRRNAAKPVATQGSLAAPAPVFHSAEGAVTSSASLVPPRHPLPGFPSSGDRGDCATAK